MGLFKDRLFNVSIESCGVKKADSGIGAIGKWSTSLDLPCSNVICKVGFKTSNSNGGVCTYTW